MSKTIKGPDGKPRCAWCFGVPEFFPYHDEEWGYPVDDDIRLFEKLCLESFQSGLSWRTILAAKDAAKGGELDNVVYETADLWFHTLVMLSNLGASSDDVLKELARRFDLSGLEEKASRKK